ncbi:DUF1772 domain-containing protein [Flavobacteriaceae bacterium M23B6Z8]
MEIKFKLVVLVLGVFFTGLTAGLCFTWSNAVTPGIGRLNDFGFLSAFQEMNRAIINPSFILVFFGPLMLLFLNAYLHRNNTLSFWLFLIAALLFFLGVILVTLFGNVPLNEMLNKTNLEKLTQLELKELRNTFEKPWNSWHTIRTITSFLAFILLVTGMIFNKATMV